MCEWCVRGVRWLECVCVWVGVRWLERVWCVRGGEMVGTCVYVCVGVRWLERVCVVCAWG